MIAMPWTVMEIVEQFRLSTFCCICKQICSRGRERTTNSGRLEGSIILQVFFLQIIMQSLGHFVWPFRKWFLEVTVGTKWTTPCARAGKTMPEFGCISCVPFGLRLFVSLESCELLILQKRHNFKKSYDLVF